MENSSIFSLNGRISRMTYWYNCFSLALLIFVIFSFSNMLTKLVGDVDKKIFEDKIAVEATSENQADTAVADSTETKIDASSVVYSESKIAATIIKIIMGLEYAVYLIFLCFAVIMSAKRWHDRGKSGLLVIISLIVFIGFAYLVYKSGFGKAIEGWKILIPIILACLIIELGLQKGQEGENKYGNDPLETQMKFYTFNDCPMCGSKYGSLDKATQPFLCKKCHSEKKVKSSDGMKENLEILFSFNGRFSKVTFWGMIITASIIGIVFGSLSYTFYEQIESTMGIVVALSLLIVFIPVIWILLSASAKRWHDANISGWLSLINIIPSGCIVWALVNILLMGGSWTGILNIILIAVGVLALIFTGFFKGVDGSNQYGEDPLLQ